jgi:DNA-binding NtrC family response regulator
MHKIVVIDDNQEFANVLASELTRRGHTVQCAYRGEEGFDLVARESPELVFLDLRLPDVNGVDVLGRVKAHSPEVAVVIVTGYPQLSSALAAMKHEALDYLCKPFEFEELGPVLDRAFARRPLALVPPVRPRPSDESDGEPEMIGPSEASQALRGLIQQLAVSGVRAVLVTGESGTGKELVARRLHTAGHRRRGPLVEVNCSAITETLFESELFGYERGAFTGAVGSRRGLAEMADGGTLFLDEIADTPLGCQAKLLRFLDDQTFFRVGGTRKIRVDVRVVAATNRDLKAMLAEGTFRGDLYHRLYVAPVAIAPLRARPDDIMPLARYWLKRIGAEHGRPGVRFTSDAEAVLRAYAWPGNVRELRNLIERLIVLGRPGDHIAAAQLPPDLFAETPGTAWEPVPDAAFLDKMERARESEAVAADADEAADTQSLDELGQAHIRKVLAKVNGNKTKAAEILGISRQTLRSKLGSAS